MLKPRMSELQIEVNRRVGALHELLDKFNNMGLGAMRPTVITVSCMNDGPDGLWLMHHPDYDKALLARRLRMAADHIERGLPLAPPPAAA
jgi:hypothetical protein